MNAKREFQPARLDLERGPLVVGTISTRAGFDAVAAGRGPARCDVVEVRLDQFALDPEAWRAGCKALGDRGVPILATIRHVEEGGGWSGSAKARIKWYRALFPWVAAVDVEIRQEILPALIGEAASAGTMCIGSFHDFRALPPGWFLDGIVESGVRQGADIIKIAVRLADETSMEEAAGLLRRFPDRRIALVGMGPLGPVSRRAFPRAGSCLTYGYLDRPVALGQVAAEALWAVFQEERDPKGGMLGRG